MRASLSQPANAGNSSTLAVIEDTALAQAVYTEEDMNWHDNDAQWEHDANEVVFDDMGEGAGIEGDLDIDDD